MNQYTQEVLSQPDSWRHGAEVAVQAAGLLPKPGMRVALVGCGTSFYVSQAVASYREARGLGETDAFAASEMPMDRHYDLLIAISRSGTTTEVLDVLRASRANAPVLAITAVSDGPLGGLVEDQIVLDWADERSIVQTRFATTVLAILLSHCGWDVEASAQRAAAYLGAPLPHALEAVNHFVFLGRGFAAAIASEAALKLRETLGAWTEAYPTREFRHGPISAVNSHSMVWMLDNEEPSIDASIEATGAHLVRGDGDPLAELVRIHLAAGHLADQAHMDPGAPRHLTRSIVLEN